MYLAGLINSRSSHFSETFQQNMAELIRERETRNRHLQQLAQAKKPKKLKNPNEK